MESSLIENSNIIPFPKGVMAKNKALKKSGSKKSKGPKRNEELAHINSFRELVQILIEKENKEDTSIQKKQ